MSKHKFEGAFVQFYKKYLQRGKHILLTVGLLPWIVCDNTTIVGPLHRSEMDTELYLFIGKDTEI